MIELTQGPRVLDLFCGAGGCSEGYRRAGFGTIVGIDVNPQPDYPFEFVQADAMTYPLDGFDFVHASPPCQKFSTLTNLGKTAGENAPDLVWPVRQRLRASGLPYVIENVVGSPLLDPYVLCGSMFGLSVRRHRLFETSFPLMVPSCSHHLQKRTIGVWGDHPQVSKGMNRAHTLVEAQEAMGIDWMPWRTLTQAIPPAYTEFIGRQAIAQMEAVA